MVRIPSLEDVVAAQRELGDLVRHTPVWAWDGPRLRDMIPEDTRVVLKLELLQVTGSFKPRGALLNAMALSSEARCRGLTAVSAGNHAMAVAHAARVLGCPAKVVMPQNANPARVAGAKRLGAEILLVPDVHTAFAEVKRIETEEGMAFIHPFEGYATALGTATVSLEMCQDAGELDALIIPIGGGGLAAGMACCAKQMQPGIAVFGVEPEGADSMHRSFASGKPEGIERVRTIADSLGAPHAAPYSFELCRRFVDEIVLIDDLEIQRAMAVLFYEAKLAVEPAGAAATAALLGPLRERLRGKRVGIVVCGANIDPVSFSRYLEVGAGQLPA